mgnify:CR=1 FL=1
MFNINTDTYIKLEEKSSEKIEEMTKMQNSYLLNATMEALQTGNLAPIIKEELKYTIQSRRLTKGQDELTVDFQKEVKYELTEEEKEKVVRRKEQNKEAAKRFRTKKKTEMKLLSQRIQALETDNRMKDTEINRLRTEKAKLQTLLQQHLTVCPMRDKILRIDPRQLET